MTVLVVLVMELVTVVVSLGARLFGDGAQNSGVCTRHARLVSNANGARICRVWISLVLLLVPCDCDCLSWTSRCL